MKNVLVNFAKYFVSAVIALVICFPAMTVKIAPDKAPVSAQTMTTAKKTSSKKKTAKKKKTKAKKNKTLKAGWGHQYMASGRKDGYKKK